VVFFIKNTIYIEIFLKVLEEKKLKLYDF
jgi:hypothetical protein